MHEIVGIIERHWPLFAALLPCLIEITPIKLNPLTALFRWIGRHITDEVMQEIKEIKAKQAEQQATIDANELDRIRYEVLDFANSCRNGRKHTKDEFEHIIVLNTKYHNLLDKTGDENGVFDAEYEYILELYRRCQRENTFL